MEVIDRPYLARLIAAAARARLVKLMAMTELVSLAQPPSCQLPYFGAARALHKRSRRHNRDATKRIEHQQLGIAGHDHIGFAVHGQFQKLVILGITAQRDTLGDRSALSADWRPSWILGRTPCQIGRPSGRADRHHCRGRSPVVCCGTASASRPTTGSQPPWPINPVTSTSKAIALSASPGAALSQSSKMAASPAWNPIPRARRSRVKHRSWSIT